MADYPASEDANADWRTQRDRIKRDATLFSTIATSDITLLDGVQSLDRIRIWRVGVFIHARAAGDRRNGCNWRGAFADFFAVYIPDHVR
ncbi:hypothetical protein [Nostoc sp.]|uniref:hypothetical protein n=1 Tax=Nostoc sp. TaxID=1180 RepID=UPI002FFBCF26